MATAEMPSRPSLDKDIRADVCVVGAGIAGLTTAYLLAEEGKDVVVLDMDRSRAEKRREPRRIWSTLSMIAILRSKACTARKARGLRLRVILPQ
jgi:glycine/D-amino acid oxidase-like deaminating enzyme